MGGMLQHDHSYARQLRHGHLLRGLRGDVGAVIFRSSAAQTIGARRAKSYAPLS